MKSNQDKKSSYRSFRDYREKILSRERNTVVIQPEALLSIALVFPNSYAVGMANLGFQAVYRLLNQFPGVRCERAFCYEQFPDVTRTLESGEELQNFDIVAFSIAYELDFPNLVQILLRAGIAPFSEKRHPLEPLIMAGGAIAFLNPQPIAPFIDFFYLGEIEPQLNSLLNLLVTLKQNNTHREEILSALAEAEGIYVPSSYASNRILRKNYLPFKDAAPQYSPVVSPDSHFKNMFLTEVGRGCGRYCNFCAASHIYHPFRIFALEKILTTIETQHQSAKRIGLIGAALSDYPQLLQLCEELVARGFELGLSSFRLDMITPSFLKTLEQGKLQSLSFAPEAGSERLRSAIHKNLSEQQILEASDAIAHSNINQIKLYFLIGLPGEQDEDIASIVELVRSIHKILCRTKRKTISLSVNTFIPKPFTPFQWSAMETAPEIQRKRNYLEKELRKIKGVTFTRKSVKQEILQGIFSLGGQNIAAGIYEKLKNNLDWQTTWNQVNLNIESILHKTRELNDGLPWDFIGYSISKERLWREWQRSKREKAQNVP